MRIKNRLSLYFTLISSGVLLLVLVAIYVAIGVFSRTDFFARLKDRASVAAQLYLEADEISSDSLNTVRELYLEKLPGELVRFYDSRNAAAFIQDRQQYWTSDVIEKVRKQGYLQYVDGQRQVVGIDYKDNQGDFVILVSARDIGANERMRSVAEVMFAVFVIVSLVMFFVGRWYAQKALSPIQKVIGEMKQIRVSNLHLRVSQGKEKDEISELVENVNGLLEHLENAFELQKAFVANASHELRTPVTSTIGEVEVALSKPRTLETYEQVLHSVLENSENLKNTITGLMELAQVDMDYAQTALMPVRIDELIWELGDFWISKVGPDLFKMQILHLPEKEALLTMNTHKQLLLIALNNIIGNAFKFSQNKPVVFTFYADDSLIRLEVADQGMGISEKDQLGIFDSFYRGEQAQDTPGNGIGLYVTGKIVQLLNGHIHVKSTVGQGSVFSVEFFH